MSLVFQEDRIVQDLERRKVPERRNELHQRKAIAMLQRQQVEEQTLLNLEELRLNFFRVQRNPLKARRHRRLMQRLEVED